MHELHLVGLLPKAHVRLAVGWCCSASQLRMCLVDRLRSLGTRASSQAGTGEHDRPSRQTENEAQDFRGQLDRLKQVVEHMSGQHSQFRHEGPYRQPKDSR